MVQDIADLHRYVKHVVELTFRTVRLKSVGMPTRYRIEVYEGYKLTKTSHTSTLNKKYNPEIFPLYSSYAGGQGKEIVVDDRQSIFNNKKIWFVTAILGVFAALAVFFLKHFFDASRLPTDKSPISNSDTTKTTQSLPLSPGSSTSSYTVPHDAEFSGTWRLTGFIESGNTHYVMVTNAENRTRYLLPSGFNIDGLRTADQVDGIPVTMFSGSTKARQ